MFRRFAQKRPRALKSAVSAERNKFEDTGRISPGLDPKGPLRRTARRIFDNQVEHASRENKIRFGLIILTSKMLSQTFELCEAQLTLSDLRRDGKRQSGFKREFDPGSESTLAACLTHASRTRKWSNP